MVVEKKKKRGGGGLGGEGGRFELNIRPCAAVKFSLT
jgi:hypothetical protein